MYDVRTGASSSPLAMQAQAAVLLDLACETASYQGLSELHFFQFIRC
jgi:hypothetical protein